jgi:hypothetical protein
LFLDEAAIPDAAPGFNRISPTLFRHDATGIDVNVQTPAGIGVPKEIAEQVARTELDPENETVG